MGIMAFVGVCVIEREMQRAFLFHTNLLKSALRDVRAGVLTVEAPDDLDGE